MTADSPKVYKIYAFSQWQYTLLLQERDQDTDQSFICMECEDEMGILYVMSESPDPTAIENYIDDESFGQKCHRCLTKLLAEWDYTVSYG